MVPSFTATSPTNGAPPLPSMIVPPRMTMSNSLAMSPIPFIDCRPELPLSLREGGGGGGGAPRYGHCPPPPPPPARGGGVAIPLLRRDAERAVDHLVQRRLDLALEDIDRLD